jgi:hypothetical protein
MSKVFSIAGISNPGPKSTAVSFTKDEAGNRPWVWIANEVAAGLVPGMIVTAEKVSTGKVQTTYTKNGVEMALKVPKIQLFLGGQVAIDPPEQEVLPEATFVVSDAAKAYREAYLAKAKAVVEDDTEGF